MRCRHCATPLEHVFLDLGFAPPSNAYLSSAQLHEPEMYFPLKIFECHECWLVQTADYARADELFREDYAYFSSTSRSWLAHAARYAAMITERLALSRSSFVVEIAANDGYLLRNFVAADIPCLGIEPTLGTARAAEASGVPILQEFFSSQVANRLVAEGRTADLIVGNNVYAHVPDINDFTQGMKLLLRRGGTVTLEFPHLLELLAHTQFDTIYHEHFSYLSLSVVSRILLRAGLRVFDVEVLPTHGGSLRVYACHVDDPRTTTGAVVQLLREEDNRGLSQLAGYAGFQAAANRVKDELLAFLIAKKKLGKRVAAYGAAAKGNTLLNYAGVRPDLVEFVCDAAPSKQGKFLPGSHIPILPPSELSTRRPDFVLILPWNLAEEVVAQNPGVEAMGASWVVAVPELTVF